MAIANVAMPQIDFEALLITLVAFGASNGAFLTGVADGV
jgi:hypothetical protein